MWGAVEQLREDGSTILLTTHYLEEAQQHADRVGLMHRGVLQAQGTVSELTRMLPASIHFSLPPDVPAPPMRTVAGADQSYLVETFDLQADLKVLLDWAAAHDVELRELSAAPTRLDDVFRAIDADPASA
nr:hypothetical protein [Salsipaludibacter albus]